MGDHSYHEEGHADMFEMDGGGFDAGYLEAYCQADVEFTTNMYASGLLHDAIEERVAVLNAWPSREYWRRKKMEERRMERLTIDDQINGLTETLAELQRTKALRKAVDVLTTLKDGAVVYIEKTFPSNPEVTYKFAACRAADLWFITGQHQKAYNDQDFIKFLDKAQYVELSRPTRQVLRNSVIEDEIKAVEASE